MKKQSIILAITILLLIGVTAMQACPFKRPLTKELEASAEHVFQGTVTGYELVSVPSDVKGAEPFRLAHITFAANKSVRGQEKKQWQVNWTNGNFGLPKSLEEFRKTDGTTFEVGVVEHASKHDYAIAYKDFPKYYAAFGKLPTIVQDPCSEPYMKPLGAKSP